MSAPGLIVCEKKSRFGAALRRVNSRRSGWKVIETRSLAQATKALAEAPASLLAVEVSDANLPAALDLLLRISDGNRPAKAVALLAQEDSRLESLLREAGAIDVLASVREAPRLVRLARRQIALAPHRPLTFRESAWQRLPWQGHATQKGD